MSYPSLVKQILFNDYVQLLNDQSVAHVEVMVFNKDGIWLTVEKKDGTLQALVITDVNFSQREIVTAQVSVTIPINSTFINATVTIPALKDSTITNYVIIATINGNVAAYINSSQILSTTQATVRVQRGYLNFTLLAATGITVVGHDLTDVDVTLLNPHGSDAGVGPHGHTTTGHPVTDSSHQHGIVPTTSALTFTVNLVIIHK